MKPPQFYTVVITSALCLVLSVVLIALGQSSQHTQLDFQKRQNEIQLELQKRQAEVQKGALSDKVGGAILQDMALASIKNTKIKDVLVKNGYNVQPASSPAPSTSATSPRP